MKTLSMLFLLLLASSQLCAQNSLPFRNPDLPLDLRVADLIGRMTLEEKVKQTLYNAPAIERLGIPAYNWWNEGLHGVARAGKATVFPQAIGLAAMWDTVMMGRVADVISEEARAKYKTAMRKGWSGIYEGLTFWSPNINIFRDPRWGRGMETYGEDPYLTGRTAVAFVRGLQGSDSRYLKTIATPKHFAVHSGPEPLRHTFDARVDDRDLYETYLPAFRATIVEAHAQSVMCAYNRFRGDPCCGSNELLMSILREAWHFDGYVVSDCWAIQDFYDQHRTSADAPSSAALALISGTDLNCGVTFDSLGTAVQRGLLKEQDIDRALTRLYRARFQLGLFDPPERVPYSSIPESANDSPEHGVLAVEATKKSMVLLKNEGSLLPLGKNIRTIAVIGPNANDVDILLGNYNGTPSHPVTPLEGIRRKAGDRIKVLYARGCDVAQGTPTLEVIPASALRQERESALGLKAEYFRNQDIEGTPFREQIDSVIDFQWWDSPALSGMSAHNFSVRWSGWVMPPVSGKYYLGVRMFGGSRLYLDDSLLIGPSERHSVTTQWKEVEFMAGVPRKIRAEFWDQRSEASMQLVWSIPDPSLEEEALKAARQADIVVMMMGLSPRLEGEEMPVKIPGFLGGDRTSLDLPAQQESLMKSVVAVGKPVVLVLFNGSAVSVNWAAKNIPAILEAWYPGQAAGTALADILFGDSNPGGRLPVTFYESVNQLPPFENYQMKGRTYRYFDGTPLFPFGHGLSYTTFSYSNLKIPNRVKAGENLTLAVDVRNSGSREGDEVVQAYVKDLQSSVPVPIRALQGFTRLSLKPGQTKTVTFVIDPRQLSLIDNKSRRVVEPGFFEITVGGKQPGFSGLANATTTETLSAQVEIVGEEVLLER